MNVGARVRLLTLVRPDKWARTTFAHVIESRAVGEVTEARADAAPALPYAVQWPGFAAPQWHHSEELEEVVE
jgi:hypothetical protein